VIFYGIVSAEWKEALELFLDRRDAETFVAECLADEPEWAETLRIEEIAFELSPN